MSERVRLTERVLKGMREGLELITAGDAADLFGVTEVTPKQEATYRAACDGLRWVRQELARRSKPANE